MSHYFAVVTKTNEEPSGNLASVHDLYVEVDQPSKENGYRSHVENLIDVAVRRGDRALLDTILCLRQPVFHVGEILILDAETGREVGYPGRKPSKWFIRIEEFDQDLEGAIRRAREVFEESLRTQAAGDPS